MEIVNGVEVLTTIEELVDPTRTAVIVVDMQNEIAAKGGGYAKHGSGVSHRASIVPGIQRLLTSARQAGVLVIYAEFIHRNKQGVTLMNGPNVCCHRGKTFVSDVIEGTWEAQTVDALAPQGGDVVIRKSRGSAMYHTPLDDILHTHGMRSLVITGTSTGGCVLYTAMDTAHRGYYPVIVRDCVSPQDSEGQFGALAWMARVYYAFDSEEVMSMW
jgi:ureidoacrylate peracid hydrolase